MVRFGDAGCSRHLGLRDLDLLLDLRVDLAVRVLLDAAGRRVGRRQPLRGQEARALEHRVDLRLQVLGDRLAAVDARQPRRHLLPDLQVHLFVGRLEALQQRHDRLVVARESGGAVVGEDCDLVLREQALRTKSMRASTALDGSCSRPRPRTTRKMRLACGTSETGPSRSGMFGSPWSGSVAISRTPKWRISCSHAVLDERELALLQVGERPAVPVRHAHVERHEHDGAAERRHLRPRLLAARGNAGHDGEDCGEPDRRRYTDLHGGRFYCEKEGRADCSARPAEPGTGLKPRATQWSGKLNVAEGFSPSARHGAEAPCYRTALPDEPQTELGDATARVLRRVRVRGRRGDLPVHERAAHPRGARVRRRTDRVEVDGVQDIEHIHPGFDLHVPRQREPLHEAHVHLAVQRARDDPRHRGARALPGRYCTQSGPLAGAR